MKTCNECPNKRAGYCVEGVEYPDKQMIRCDQLDGWTAPVNMDECPLTEIDE